MVLCSVWFLIRFDRLLRSIRRTICASFSGAIVTPFTQCASVLGYVLIEWVIVTSERNCEDLK